MIEKNQKKMDSIIEMLDKRLSMKVTKTRVHTYVAPNKGFKPVKVEIKDTTLLTEIKDNLLESKSVFVSFDRMKFLPKGIQNALLKAPKVQKTKRSYLFDFEPEVEGCSNNYSTHERTYALKYKDERLR